MTDLTLYIDHWGDLHEDTQEDFEGTFDQVTLSTEHDEWMDGWDGGYVSAYLFDTEDLAREVTKAVADYALQEPAYGHWQLPNGSWVGILHNYGADAGFEILDRRKR